MIICGACGKEIEGKGLTHHTSYFPEATIEVHNSCHTKIHRTDLYPTLRPSDYDSIRFYGPKKPSKIVTVATSTRKALTLLKVNKGFSTMDDTIKFLLSGVKA